MQQNQRSDHSASLHDEGQADEGQAASPPILTLLPIHKLSVETTAQMELSDVQPGPSSPSRHHRSRRRRRNSRSRARSQLGKQKQADAQMQDQAPQQHEYTQSRPASPAIFAQDPHPQPTAQKPWSAGKQRDRQNQLDFRQRQLHQREHQQLARERQLKQREQQWKQQQERRQQPPQQRSQRLQELKEQQQQRRQQLQQQDQKDEQHRQQFEQWLQQTQKQEQGSKRILQNPGTGEPTPLCEVSDTVRKFLAQDVSTDSWNSIVSTNEASPDAADVRWERHHADIRAIIAEASRQSDKVLERMEEEDWICDI
ncbi:hypothetical protein TWF696_007150 [Orbilia brochopaga]|uniref:Uncharacterized protein n=1 Tax=Orbilia brochopaga TaxID=3140254 RepID=A0AAV9UTJ9_9PEZI